MFVKDEVCETVLNIVTVFSVGNFIKVIEVMCFAIIEILVNVGKGKKGKKLVVYGFDS